MKSRKWKQPQNEDVLKNEDNLNNEDDLKNENNPKNVPFSPSIKKNIIWILFECSFTLTATALMLNQKCYQASKPEMEYNMMNIINVALHIYMYAKMTMQSLTYIQYGSCGKGPKAQSSVLTMHPFNNFYIDKDG